MLCNVSELRIFRGYDIPIGKGISIRQPTLGEIDDIGEEKYFNLVQLIVATPFEIRYRLNQMGIDFTEIDEFELFWKMICWSLEPENTKILFGENVNFTQLKVYENPEIHEIVLMSEDGSVLINRPIYQIMTDALRELHGLKKHVEIPANPFAKKCMLEDAEDEYLMNKDKEFESILMPMISSMVVMPGFKHDEVSVFDMKIGAFIDAVKRNSHIKRADIYLQSGYSGFGISLKDIQQDAIDYFSRIEG